MNEQTVWLRYTDEPYAPSYAFAVFTTAEAAKASVETAYAGSHPREWVPDGSGGWFEEHRDLATHWVIEPLVLDPTRAAAAADPDDTTR